MGLFEKKKEEKKSCCCSCGASAENAPVSKECCGSDIDGICCIKVLGAGCKSCHQQYENVKEAVKELGLDIEVEYITDFAKIGEYGVMSMPAIVVNEKVVSAGKVLSASDFKKTLDKFI